jgi:hypothetical protein
MRLCEKFPPLYQCEGCGKAVKVTHQGEGVEPLIEKKCGCPLNEKNGVVARRKVTLRGKGSLDGNVLKKTTVKITLTLRQFLSALTGRSI